MKTNSRLIFTSLALLVVLSCCKDDDDGLLTCIDPTNPECPNYDPCHGVEPPSAAFTIQESIHKTYPAPNEWIWMPDDSVFVGRSDIRFTSPYTSDEYKHTWYLGTEVIHDASFTRDFSSVPTEQRPYQVSITHVLEYPLDNDCYSNATGRDSVSRTYTLVRYFDELKTFGKYRGAFENQKDSFDFQIRVDAVDGGRADRDTPKISYISNFHNEGDTLLLAFSLSNRMLALLTSFGPYGFLEIKPNSDNFIFEYRHRNQIHVVKGRKID